MGDRCAGPAGAGVVARPCPKPGDLPRCQLCPLSPTYWRNQAPAAVAVVPVAAVPPSRVWAGVLDWGVGAAVRGAGLMFGHRKCSICGGPTITISPRGKNVHKTCAEQWAAQHRRPQGVDGGVHNES